MPKAAPPRRRKPRLLASSQLSDRKIRQVIRCYCNRVPPREAQTVCGLSHVTVYRIYRHIRRRLLALGVYKSMQDQERLWDDMQREGYSYAAEIEFERYAKTALGMHRGIRPENKNLYVSEVIFRFENEMTPGQLYRYIIVSIDTGGPLNRPPIATDSTALDIEFMRQLIQSSIQLDRASAEFLRVEREEPDLEEQYAELDRYIAKAKKSENQARKSIRRRPKRGS